VYGSQSLTPTQVKALLDDDVVDALTSVVVIIGSIALVTEVVVSAVVVEPSVVVIIDSVVLVTGVVVSAVVISSVVVSACAVVESS